MLQNGGMQFVIWYWYEKIVSKWNKPPQKKDFKVVDILRSCTLSSINPLKWMNILPPDLQNDQSNQTMMISVLWDWYIRWYIRYIYIYILGTYISYIVLRCFKRRTLPRFLGVIFVVELFVYSLSLEASSGRRLWSHRPPEVGGIGNEGREFRNSWTLYI